MSEERSFYWGGCDVLSLAAEYGTPLYVYDEEALRTACREYRRVFEAEFPDCVVAYAAKAFWCKAMAQLVHEEGLHVDVVSGGEIHIGLAAGFPAQHMIFHGNNKTATELRMALLAGVGRIVVDNLDELELLSELCQATGKKARVLLRVVPGVRAETHEFIQTGQRGSKFGLPWDDGSAFAAIRRVVADPHLSFLGLHCHLGSQILNTAPFEEAARVMAGFVRELRDSGFEVLDLNLGGGLGVSHVPEERPASVEEMARALAQGLAELPRSMWPRVIVEPGRSIVGQAGITLYTVGAVKRRDGEGYYVAVDGGMGDNLRPMLYGARYEALVANRVTEEATREYTIVGKYCESSDVLVEKVKLPPMRRGDILVIPATGAYAYAMANVYNGNPRAAVVFARAGRANLVVRRETYEDLLARDLGLTKGERFTSNVGRGTRAAGN